MRVNDIARAQVNRAAGLPPEGRVTMHITVPRQLADEITADAKSKSMTVNSFMRAMIRGYFGSACRP